MIILCADDYALTEGISRAIGELAAARRLSATSALVTSPYWPTSAPRLLAHRQRMSIGLHLDLTLGPPLGPMPRLAPTGTFPGLPWILARALSGLLDPQELEAEIARQLDHFEQTLGFAPDHIDGHQHVHALPRVRQALFDVVKRRYPSNPPLLRDPADLTARIRGRGVAVRKALLVRQLSAGFADAAHDAGFPTNSGFSGYSDFNLRVPYAGEFNAALRDPGPRHIVMCHPGHVDADLRGRDRVVERREMEYEALMREPDLPQRIWRPARAPDGPVLAWPIAPGEVAA